MEQGIVAALVAAAKQAREDKNISPEKMGALLQQSGAGSISKVSRFENGKQYGEIDRTLGVYADAAGLSLLELLSKAEKQLAKSPAASKKPKRPAKRVSGAKLTPQQAKAESERHQAELESELSSRSRRSRPSGGQSAKPKRGSQKK